ncbi:hypothetical protein [Variovorax sp. PBS-H4]|uniref:hypothetical protein n=1 Tax=Variovorax sp. PBS-H4 TaxID=434008 RepID=UPI0013A57BF1|nr:hypothetical protein [Variovorax sp. PBS-H4]
MTADERAASTSRVAEKYEALLEAKVADPWGDLKAYVLAQPEFVEAELGKESLWARFRDGRQFLFTDNLKPLARPLSAESLQRMERPGDALQQKGASGNGKPEVPASGIAVFLSADDQGNFAYAKAAQARIAEMLKDRGWTIAPQKDLTIDTLMSLSTTKMGILHLTAHSALIGPTGVRQFGVITETLTTDELDARYKAELDSGEIIYHRNRARLKEMLLGQQRPRYGITEAFVRNRLKFSENSLVVMVSCESGTPDAAGFRQGLTDAGAGTIIAWDGSSNDIGHVAMKIMFDRLTAANKFDAKDPANRAFDMEAVWDYLGKRGFEQDGYVYTNNLLVTPDAEGKGQAPAFVKRFGNGFDLTNPVITDLETRWKDIMVVHGNFGTKTGTVTVGGTPVQVSAWSDDRIEVNLPTADNDPPGSMGDVVVTARDRTSNRRVLTSWRGSVEYTFETLPIPGSTGLLTSVLNLDLHVRGDAHELRTEVDGSLGRSVRLFVPASDTKASYKSSGTNSSGLFTRTWSGSGTLPYTGFGFDGNSLSLHGSIDAIGRLFKLSPAVVGQDLLKVKTTSISETKETTTFLPFHTDALGFTNAFGGDTASYGTLFTLDYLGNVPAYDKRLAVPTLPPDSAWMRVKTSGMTASPAFDGTVGR